MCTPTDFVAHLKCPYRYLPPMKRYDWVMDNLNPIGAWPSAVWWCRWCRVPFASEKFKRGIECWAFLSDPSHRHVFHFTPKHGSWLNQAELFFGTLQHHFLARGSFLSVKDSERHLEHFLPNYNPPHAHPDRWTCTGEPLMRDTLCRRARRQQRRGRAWVSPRSRRLERLLYSLRAYRRQVTLED